MFNKKNKVTLMKGEWVVLKKDVIVDVIPSKGDYIFFNKIYYLVVMVVHHINNKTSEVVIVVEEEIKKIF